MMQCIMKKAAPPRLRKFPAAKQRLLDRLLERNSEGAIGAKERLELEKLVAEAERLMAANAKLLARFSRDETQGVPAGAVPVTVWVRPGPAEQ